MPIAAHSVLTSGGLHRHAELVDAYLRERVDAADLPENLADAVRYAVLGPGKRLRPTLALLGSEAVGGTVAEALPAAAAIELVHAFSLVHDDLPAMDDDDLRRGRPTLHIQAGEAMAILAGDVMVPLAFACIAESGLGPERIVALTRELSRATIAMIAGQVYDTLGRVPDSLSARQELESIHRHKTGALIRAACRMGALAGRATDGQLEAVSKYGEAVGLMFQIVDDLLDVTQSSEHLGKTAGKDAPAGKRTFPGVIGIEGSKREVERLRREAAAAVAAFGQAGAPMIGLCNQLAVRTR